MTAMELVEQLRVRAKAGGCTGGETFVLLNLAADRIEQAEREAYGMAKHGITAALNAAGLRFLAIINGTDAAKKEE